VLVVGLFPSEKNFQGNAPSWLSLTQSPLNRVNCQSKRCPRFKFPEPQRSGSPEHKNSVETSSVSLRKTTLVRVERKFNSGSTVWQDNQPPYKFILHLMNKCLLLKSKRCTATSYLWSSGSQLVVVLVTIPKKGSKMPGR